MKVFLETFEQQGLFLQKIRLYPWSVATPARFGDNGNCPAMAILQQSARLRKELSLFSVFAIATGTTLSAGFFLLPGLAAEQAGSAVILCYMIAGALVVPPMLSIVELATAMPRAGGAYYFLDRSLGPLAGTIGGLGIWLALVLKASFALIGMGAYVYLIVDLIGQDHPSVAVPRVASITASVGLLRVTLKVSVLSTISSSNSPTDISLRHSPAEKK